MEPMDPPQSKFSQHEDTSTMKMIRGASCGLVAGTIVCMAVPRLTTLKMIGNYGLTFATSGGLCIGVEESMQNFRMKADILNVAGGAAAAMLPLMGPNGRKISFIPTVAAITIFNFLFGVTTPR